MLSVSQFNIWFFLFLSPTRSWFPYPWSYPLPAVQTIFYLTSFLSCGDTGHLSQSLTCTLFFSQPKFTLNVCWQEMCKSLLELEAVTMIHSTGLEDAIVNCRLMAVTLTCPSVPLISQVSFQSEVQTYWYGKWECSLMFANGMGELLAALGGAGLSRVGLGEVRLLCVLGEVGLSGVPREACCGLKLN